MTWLRSAAGKSLPLLLVALAAAGCAGRGEATGDASSEEDREAALLAFTECMREQGVDMPDPETGDGGPGLRLGRPRGDIDDADREQMDEAREACDEHLEGSLQELTPEQESEMQDRMLAFARCMRENGVDMPDPDFSNVEGERRGFVRGLGVDPDDPEFQKANETCREEVFEGQEGGPGPGGRVFIGGRRSG